MLNPAGMALPKSVVVHGFIAGADGRKMSEPPVTQLFDHNMKAENMMLQGASNYLEFMMFLRILHVVLG